MGRSSVEDKSFAGGLVTGTIMTLFVLSFFFVIDPDSPYNLLTDCKESLPRNQQCVLIAVPEGDRVQASR